MKALDYAFLSGKIRVLEKKLPNEIDIERMIDAPTIDDCFKVFYDTDYANNLLEKKPEEFEKVISDDLLDLKKLIFQFIPDEDLKKLLLLEFDFHNIKAIIDEKLSQKKIDHLIFQSGFFNLNDIKKSLIEGQEFEDRDFQEVIKKIRRFLEKKPKIFEIQCFLDKEYFSLFKDISKKLESSFLLRLINSRIDFLNLRIFLRFKKLNRKKEELTKALLGDGNIKEKDFLDIYEKDEEKQMIFLSKFFSFKLKKYFLEYVKTKNLKKIKKELEKLEIDYLKDTKFLPFGPEVVIAYFYLKLYTNRNVRLIMHSRLNEIDKEFLRKELRRIW